MKPASCVWSSGVVLIVIGLIAMAPPSDSTPPAAPSSDEPAKQSEPTEGLAPPTITDAEPRGYNGLHNVVAYHEGYLSGSVPEGDEGFDTLRAMGVMTIISVDGAVPDLEMARARGIRYIHLPIGYNGFDEKRKLELVRATRDAMENGPVYIHCHHGKHRSAGAAAAVVASLGWLTPEQVVARMKVSGTAPNYKGLYSGATNATVLDATVIDAVPAEFPEVSQPATFVKAMVEVDIVNDHLKVIEKAGWTVPKDHPDLVPVAEAGRLADLFRLVLESEKAAANPPEFAQWLARDGEHAQSLEDLLLANEVDAAKLSGVFKLIQTSCKECHAKYRD